MIRYRLATNDDNQQLIELTSSSGMQGEISLRIDRKPDFFKLLAMRGSSRVFVALDENVIVGSICVSQQEVYVGGQITPLQYFADFKIATPYRNRTIGFRLCRELENHVLTIGADLAFANFSKGNIKPFRFLSNRKNTPDFENIGIFYIHQFVGKKKKASNDEHEIVASTITDDLIRFLNDHYRNHELGSVITKEKLLDTSIFTIQHENKIIAAMVLQDTMDAKQNVVTNVSWKMNILLRTMTKVNYLLGLSKMPGINEPIRMIYIKYLAADNNNKQIVRFLINHARNIAFEKSYSFASIGVHEKDPVNTHVKGLFKLTFSSVGMVLSLKDNKDLIEKIKQGIPFSDYSLV